MKMNIRLYIICIAAVLALVVPSLADSNNTATVHGGVYQSDTFETLDNAMVEVNSTPSQSMVAKLGMYSFELVPGDYSITAKYYQNGTLLYSGGEIVHIKDEGNYVKDLLLFPIYSEALMDSSEVSSEANGSSEKVDTTDKTNTSGIVSEDGESEIDFSTSSSILLAFLLLILITGGYQFSRKRKKEEKSAFKEVNSGHRAESGSKPENVPYISREISNKESRMSQVFQENASEMAYVNTQAVDPESRITATEKTEKTEQKTPVKELVTGSETKIPEKIPVAEGNEHHPEDEDLTDSEIEEGVIISVKEPEDNLDTNTNTSIPGTETTTPEIPAAPKKKLPLPSDLQEVMDIIRGQGGRITQKDLRSKLKYSEGKVSLMLADLERRELIEKFKRGRGNVIIVKDEER